MLIFLQQLIWCVHLQISFSCMAVCVGQKCRIRWEISKVCIDPVQAFGDGGSCVCVTCQMVLHVLSTWFCGNESNSHGYVRGTAKKTHCFSQIAPGSRTMVRMTSKTTSALTFTGKKSYRQDQDIPADIIIPWSTSTRMHAKIHTVYDMISHQGVWKDMIWHVISHEILIEIWYEFIQQILSKCLVIL